MVFEFLILSLWLPIVQVVETCMPSSKQENGGCNGTAASAVRCVHSVSEMFRAFLATTPIFKPITKYGPTCPCSFRANSMVAASSFGSGIFLRCLSGVGVY